jgi:hypothetical protein
MAIKDLIGNGMGYGGSPYYVFTRGLEAGPGSVTPFVPGPSAGIFKVGGSLLKVGTHLAKDTACCCRDVLDADCLGRTGFSPNHLSVAMGTFTNGSFNSNLCDCSAMGGTYILTPGGSECCAWCGGTYGDSLPTAMGCLNPALWLIGRSVVAQLSAVVPPSLPTGGCPYSCGTQIVSIPEGLIFTGCNYHKDNPAKRPNLYWWVRFVQGYTHKTLPGASFSWTGHFFSSPIAYDSVANRWPILGSFSLTKVTYTQLPCGNAGGHGGVEDDPWPFWALETCQSTTCTLTVTA